VKVREDRGDGSSATTLSVGQLSAPGSWIEVREQKLIHRIIYRISFEQDVANFN
jgi:hypothetical protein